MRFSKAVILLAAVLACRAASYGEFVEAGSVVQTETLRIVVPRDRLRVSVDNPHDGDVVMYEDFGSGLPRGLVLVVQSRAGNLGADLLSELRSFRGPESNLLSEADIIDSSRGDGELQFLLRVPALKEPLGESGSLVHRQELYLSGVLVQHGTRILRLHVAWNPLPSLGPGAEESLDRERLRALEALDQLRRAVELTVVPSAA